MPFCHREKRKPNADQGAVKGHAALPDMQDQKRIFQIIGSIIEKHITKPPTKNDADQQIIKQPIRLVGCHNRMR